jgi:hypothetical protein
LLPNGKQLNNGPFIECQGKLIFRLLSTYINGMPVLVIFPAKFDFLIISRLS